VFNSIEIENVRKPLEKAYTLPPDAYRLSRVFEVEKETVFYREWICIARAEQLPEPGDFILADVIDQPVIVARQNDGELRAMSAVCPHRGMPVVTENGKAMQFQCPYHLWKFRLDGKLISAPMMEGVDELKDCDLAAIRVCKWEGFIFVNLDASAAPLNDRLAELNKIVGAYKMSDMRIVHSEHFDSPWNWKVLLENFMEAYHHIGPHRESLQGDYPAKDSYVSGSIENGWSVLHMPKPGGNAEESALPNIDGLEGEQKTSSLASTILPTMAFINSPAIAFWYQLSPKTHDSMDLTIHTMVPKSITQHPEIKAIGDLVAATIRQIHLEDIHANEGPFRGLKAPLTRQGRLSRLEEAIWQINQWWLDRVIDR